MMIILILQEEGMNIIKHMTGSYNSTLMMDLGRKLDSYNWPDTPMVQVLSMWRMSWIIVNDSYNIHVFRKVTI